MPVKSTRTKAIACARDRILASARKLIAQHGFEATSTKEIAAHAGVPSGLVFYYFKTKEELLEAIFSESSPLGVIAAMREAAMNAPGDRIETALRAAFSEGSKRRYEIQILTAEVASTRPIGKQLRQMRRDALAGIADFFRTALDGAQPAVDPEILAQVVGSAVIMAIVLDQPPDVDAYIAGLVALIRTALAPATPPART
jgi:AcrR family transcriptional regulator